MNPWLFFTLLIPEVAQRLLARTVDLISIGSATSHDVCWCKCKALDPPIL